ncbi:hypothetical protein [Candidatus Methanocrinis natronophilus]|uniref:Uncharacterized protein n=1 Tax=Candidatus Methanocrinis natronophilus TaxID=3033396 RepID=A0ABT5XBM2_9EURY|nr:hypothetical protein [Candidatus Methanocrinis natronophilus]MDF0591942.1 hypothetical protein [Candidatus Methanocrinis natronophilus]
MKEVFKVDRSGMAKKHLQMSDGVLEIVGGITKSKATVLLADEEKRRKKRSMI